MPHKHKRKADSDESNYDLPPSLRAAPLPTGKARAPNPAPRSKKRKISNVEGYGQDDTPKAFARLMQFQTSGKRRSGLDDGRKPKSKKQQKQARQKAAAEVEQEAAPNSEEQPQAVPKIQPGEKLSEFSQRVNQALPLTGVSRSGKKIAGLSDHRVTKHEKRLKRLQEGWRKEEARLRDKEQEERELAEEEQDEVDLLWEDKTAELPSSTNSGKKGKKKGKRKLVVGEVEDKHEDEWEALRKKQDARKGLHDVVHAPPQFDKLPREVFKVKNGARVNVDSVPSRVGSLRKREELGEERQNIIDSYRKLMAAKKGA